MATAAPSSGKSEPSNVSRLTPHLPYHIRADHFEDIFFLQQMMDCHLRSLKKLHNTLQTNLDELLEAEWLGKYDKPFESALVVFRAKTEDLDRKVQAWIKEIDEAMLRVKGFIAFNFPFGMPTSAFRKGSLLAEYLG
ncbi:MAG: hypothetical protein Q9179_001157 [Wetmoreana sp. 5 TL-2023]